MAHIETFLNQSEAALLHGLVPDPRLEVCGGISNRHLVAPLLLYRAMVNDRINKVVVYI